MNWLDTDSIYQRTSEGEARAHAYYYVYCYAPIVPDSRYWVAGRYWFNEEVDYRIKFESASQAREYCELKDQSAVIIVGQEA